jgi:hypothetical protein
MRIRDETSRAYVPSERFTKSRNHFSDKKRDQQDGRFAKRLSLELRGGVKLTFAPGTRRAVRRSL